MNSVETVATNEKSKELLFYDLKNFHFDRYTLHV